MTTDPLRELVVARYRENCTWLASARGWSIRVLRKADAPGPGELPNIGREAHSYLSHIVERYDSLADVTAFVQGNPFDHAPHLLNRLAAIDAHTEFCELGNVAVVEDRRGEPSHPGLDLDAAHRSLFGTPSPEYVAFRAGACFAVSRAAIRSRPRAFYRRTLEWCIASPQGAWELERLWPLIFAPPARTRGIVTACDALLFADLQYCLRSLRRVSDLPVELFDLGLTPRQRDWCTRRIEGLTLKALPPLANRTQRNVRLPLWQTWLKPFYLLHASFDRALWVDADCVFLRDPADALDEIAKAPLLVADQTGCELVNRDGLADVLPSPRREPIASRVNAGVVGLDRVRDRELLAAWAWGVQFAGRNLRLAHLFRWYDQGALQWALGRLGRGGLLRTDSRWNRAVLDARLPLAGASLDSILEILHRHDPEAAVAHFLGPNKLSRRVRTAERHTGCVKWRAGSD